MNSDIMGRWIRPLRELKLQGTVSITGENLSSPWHPSSCQRTSDIPPLRKRTLIPAWLESSRVLQILSVIPATLLPKRARQSNIRANGDNGFSRRRRNGEEISRAQAEPTPVSLSRCTRVYLLTYCLSIFEDECANNRLVSFSFFLLFTF